ncbi:hypothetical protein PFLmoz3_06207 [Pseudomonas fluorescens]|uniref:Uncharacterized protein n=1 Tax=Pseudomonas fluorescens TaxID=294 RepID=A0A120FXY6_PSEFL|nr:hypothetical protein PFLmoz3_06207 [Pseudomonas fluorescens]
MALRQHHCSCPGGTGTAPGLHADPAARHQHRRAVYRVRPALLRQDRAQGLGGDRPDRGQAQREEHPAQHDRAREARGCAGAVSLPGAQLRPGARRTALGSSVRQDLLRQDRRVIAAVVGKANQRQDRAAPGTELFRPGRPAPDLRLDASHQEARHRLCGTGRAVRRRGCRSGRQLHVLRPGFGRGPYLQARNRRWPARRLGWRARTDQRPCG